MQLLAAKHRLLEKIWFILLSCFFLVFSSFPCAHAFTNSRELASVQLNVEQPPQLLAQNPSVLPTDVTPFQLYRQRAAFGSMLKFRLFQKLPAPLWFTCVTEESNRWETNVFQTNSDGRQDYVFRSLPNVTLGYALGENTNVYSNFFVIKDLYAANGAALNFPTTMSLSMGIRRDFPIKKRTVLQFDMQARELWQETHLHQADLLPAINLTRTITPNLLFFGSVLLQMRSRNLFQGATRELDPFYNIGLVFRRGDWNFSLADTYVTNFRSPPFSDSVPLQGNVSMILDFEVSHPVSRRIPGVVAFVRAEPIFNWRSQKVPGQSGYDFRLYGGLRFTISKPAYNAQIDQLRKQLIDTSKRINRINPTQSSPGTPANQNQDSSNQPTPQQTTGTQETAPPDQK